MVAVRIASSIERVNYYVYGLLTIASARADAAISSKDSREWSPCHIGQDLFGNSLFDNFDELLTRGDSGDRSCSAIGQLEPESTLNGNHHGLDAVVVDGKPG